VQDVFTSWCIQKCKEQNLLSLIGHATWSGEGYR
jgi:hypothetical protein